MKRCFLLRVFVILVALPGAGGSQTIQEIQAPVDRVTIYRDRAVVTRKANISPFSGRKTFSVQDISIEADVASVQVKSTGSLRLISFTPSLAFKSSSDNLEEKNLQEDYLAKISELRRVQQNLWSNEAILQKIGDYQSYLSDALGRYAVSGTTAPLEWQRGLDFVGKESQKRAEEMVRLKDEMKKLREDSLDLQNRLRNIRTSDGGRNVKVDVFLASAQPATPSSGKVEIRYVVRGATWRPHYDLKREGDERILLKYYGKVQQRTGENWENAKVILSTGRPDLGLKPPPIPTHTIRYVERDTKSIFLQTKEEERELKDRLGGKSGEDKAIAHASSRSEGQIFPKGLELDFSIKKRKTILANNEPHQVQVGSWKVPAKIRMVSYPALRNYVFWEAAGTNKTQFPLLAGSAHIFGRTGFIGKTHLSFTPADAKFEYSLGAVQNVRVSRTRHETKRKKNSGVPVTHERIYRYSTHLWNFSQESRPIDVIEALPVSNIEAVKVRVAKGTSPKPKVSKDGKVTWGIALKPGEKRKIEYEYSIRAPKNFVFPSE